MQTVTVEPRSGLSETEAATEVGVLILYEDFATGVRAVTGLKEVMDQVPELPELPFRLSLWRWDVLADRATREEAAQETARARIVIVAAHGQEDLPGGVKDLLEQWIDAGAGWPCALVVSLDAGRQACGGEGLGLAELLGRARGAGVDVFPHTEPVPSPESEFAVWPTTRRTETSAPRARELGLAGAG